MIERRQGMWVKGSTLTNTSDALKRQLPRIHCPEEAE